jgi:transposase InsO family protein
MSNIIALKTTTDKMAKTRRSFSPKLKLEAAQLMVDQVSPFASEEFTGVLKPHGGNISMDGKGRWVNNVFVARLWRSSNRKESTSRLMKAWERPETH